MDEKGETMKYHVGVVPEQRLNLRDPIPHSPQQLTLVRLVRLLLPELIHCVTRAETAPVASQTAVTAQLINAVTPRRSFLTAQCHCRGRYNLRSHADFVLPARSVL